MTRIHAGATVERPPGDKYVRTLHFAELTFPSSWPKPATLHKWREKVGPDLQVAVVAPRAALCSEAGPLRWDDELEARFAWYLEALEALDAMAIVPTGSELSTSRKDRERLSDLFGRIPDTRRRVWAPSGIWNDEEAHPFARKLGVTPAFDPLADDSPGGATAYVRLKALGGRQRFSEGILHELLDALEGFEEAFVAIESQRSFDEAVRLQKLADEA